MSISLPKSIVRKIMSYMDINTFCINPIKILQLMMFGLSGEKSREHRRQIWDDYCKNIMKQSSIDNNKSFKLCDENLLSDLIHIQMDIYDSMNAIYDSMNDIEDDELREQQYDKQMEYITERWKSVKNQKVINERDRIVIYTRLLNGYYHRTDHIVNYIYMPSICAMNNVSYTGITETCYYCYSMLIDGICQDVTKVEYMNYIDGFQYQSSAKILPIFMTYIKNLKEIDQKRCETNHNEKQLFHK